MSGGAIHSTGKTSYTTPEYLLAVVRNFFSDPRVRAVLSPPLAPGFAIDVDPCSNPESTVGAAVNIQLEPDPGAAPGFPIRVQGDGLAYLMGRDPRLQTDRETFHIPGVDSRRSIFENPPFGRNVGKWLGGAAYAGDRGSVVVALVPDTPDTVPWKNEVLFKAEGRCQIGHRVKYGGMETGIPKCCSFLLFYQPHFGVRYGEDVYSAFFDHFKVLGRVESPALIYGGQKNVKIWSPSKKRPNELPPLFDPETRRR